MKPRRRRIWLVLVYSAFVCSTFLVILRQQPGIAARGGGIDGDDLLGGKAAEIIRTAGLRSGSGQMRAAEGLRANHGADHAAIDINISMRQARGDALDSEI